MSEPTSKGYVEETEGHRKESYCSLRVQKERERERERERKYMHSSTLIDTNSHSGELPGACI